MGAVRRTWRAEGTAAVAARAAATAARAWPTHYISCDGLNLKTAAEVLPPGGGGRKQSLAGGRQVAVAVGRSCGGQSALC